MYKTIIFVSILVLSGCGHKDKQTDNANGGTGAEVNKAVTVKKSSNSDNKALRELKEGNQEFKWK